MPMPREPDAAEGVAEGATPVLRLRLGLCADAGAATDSRPGTAGGPATRVLGLRLGLCADAGAATDSGRVTAVAAAATKAGRRFTGLTILGGCQVFRWSLRPIRARTERAARRDFGERPGQAQESVRRRSA